MDYATDADPLPHTSDDGAVGKAVSSSHPIIPVEPLLGSEQAEALSKMCVCGDMVERFKQDCVRLRCKCMIHTHCLAQYIKSQLEDSTRISGDGIRCVIVIEYLILLAERYEDTYLTVLIFY